MKHGKGQQVNFPAKCEFSDYEFGKKKRKKKFQTHDSIAPAREPLSFSADSTVLCNSHISMDTPV